MDIVFVRLSDEDYPKLMECLPLATKHRQAVVNKKSSDEAKALSLTAELVTLNEIRKRTGTDIKRIRFALGAHGKPSLKGGDIKFSLSHTKGAVCAVFSDNEVGVDVELRARQVSDRLIERSLSAPERASVSTSEDFMRIWVKKEAFLKRTGIGVTTELKAVDTSIFPDTLAMEYGEYFIGISGKGAEDVHITEMTAEELVKCFSRDLLLI